MGLLFYLQERSADSFLSTISEKTNINQEKGKIVCLTNHKKDSENLHKYRGTRTYAGHRALLRKKVNLNPGDLVSLNGEILVVHGTHTKKNGSVNVEFKTPSRGGKKSASLKKLKIVKTTDSMHSAWEKIS